MMELMIAAGKAVAQLQIEHGLAVERVYTGSFMTALDMAGSYGTATLSCSNVEFLGAFVWPWWGRLPYYFKFWLLGLQQILRFIVHGPRLSFARA